MATAIDRLVKMLYDYLINFLTNKKKLGIVVNALDRGYSSVGRAPQWH